VGTIFVFPLRGEPSRVGRTDPPREGAEEQIVSTCGLVDDVRRHGSGVGSLGAQVGVDFLYAAGEAALTTTAT
jgi:hypothetical protein